MPPLLSPSPAGLACDGGGFHVDPVLPVPRAVVTHAHADHAVPGSGAYLTAAENVPLLRERLGPGASIEGLGWGEARSIGPVRVTFHPAGHVLGSAQVRLDHRGETWVVTGDVKTAPDPTCRPWEPLRADVLVVESTFALPVFRWAPPERSLAEIVEWWAANRERERTSLLFGHALGKAARILASLPRPLPGPVLVHGAVARWLPHYARAGVAFPDWAPAEPAVRRRDGPRPLVLAPPSAHGTPWARRFGPASSALASGHARIRGPRRRAGHDRGIALSDHADWDGLLAIVEASGAARVGTRHGHAAALARFLAGRGRETWVAEA